METYKGFSEIRVKAELPDGQEMWFIPEKDAQEKERELNSEINKLRKVLSDLVFAYSDSKNNNADLDQYFIWNTVIQEANKLHG